MKHPIQNLLLAAILATVAELVYCIIQGFFVASIILAFGIFISMYLLIKRRKIEAPLPEYKPTKLESEKGEFKTPVIPQDEAFD